MEGRVWRGAESGMSEGDANEQTSRQLSELSELLQQLVPQDGDHPTSISSLWLIRRSASGTNRAGVPFPALCFTAQGRAELLLEGDAHEFGPGQHVVSSADAPISARILGASPALPYLGLRVRLDRGCLRSLIEEARLEPPVTDAPERSALVCRAGPSLLDVVLRFVRLLRWPGEIPVLAPMIERELLFRLLMDECGAVLHSLAREEKHPEGIDAAIGWLRLHFRESFRVDVLARRTGMSVSSFHQWFRGVTGMSPLQYQKQLRLEEARRILRNEGRDVGSVSRWVGYESSSQFSREYRRLFGNPPAREIRLLRQRVGGARPKSAVR